MITRQWGFPRLFGIHPVRRQNQVGLIHVKIVDNVPHVWPIARPGSTYVDNYNHLRVHPQNQPVPNRIIRSAAPAFTPPKPQVEMDPSNSRTWQRPYRFTN